MVLPIRAARRHVLSALAAVGLAVAMPAIAEAQTELKIGYMKHPIQDASLDMMEKWAKANNVKFTRVPMAYNIFMEKVTATLTSGNDQFDLIWHNDDWGQLWEKWLEPIDDVAGMDTMSKWPMDAFWTADKKNLTAVPLAYTVGTFFYRSDLIKPNEVPKTWAELVSTSQRLQKEGKVKWGYVGGMSFNNTWFSLWWTMWANRCDIFHPLFERDNAKLKAGGFKPAIADPCHVQSVEFWWDAMKANKISPEAMTSYGRNEANAIFMAGDAAFTLVDSTHYGDFSDPAKSKIVGKIGMAPFPVGPMAQVPTAWHEIWGWGIPKGSPADKKKLTKAMLGAMMTDEAGQIEMWKKTGGPPPNNKVLAKIAAEDPVFKELKNAVFDQKPVTHSAYYFAEWPAVHKAYSDVVIKALIGKREDIKKTLEEGAPLLTKAAMN